MKSWYKCKGDDNMVNKAMATPANLNSNVRLDVEDSLTQLYRKFQDEFVQNPQEGQTSVVSHSHLVCNGSKGKKVVTISDLLLHWESEIPEIVDIMKFATLLPEGAHFYIIHYPESYDIFTIIWKDGKLVIPGKGVTDGYFTGPRSVWSAFTSPSWASSSFSS